MARASSPPSVKLICGMISARKDLFDESLAAMTQALGPADIISEIMDFDFTHYYDSQMGRPLYRRFASFERLVTPEALVDAKLTSNEIEREFAARTGNLSAGDITLEQLSRLSGKEPPPPAVARPINLDPGYVESSKLVLASMKNFSHRLYLGRGVYGEVTLMFHKGRWDAFAWTFPDYASGRYHPFLTAAREKLRRQQLEGAPK